MSSRFASVKISAEGSGSPSAVCISKNSVKPVRNEVCCSISSDLTFTCAIARAAAGADRASRGREGSEGDAGRACVMSARLAQSGKNAAARTSCCALRYMSIRSVSTALDGE
jgi:hypothetical protein